MRPKWNRDLVYDLFSPIHVSGMMTLGITLGLLGWAMGATWIGVTGIGFTLASVAIALSDLVTNAEGLALKALVRDRAKVDASERAKLDKVAVAITNFPSKQIREDLKSLRSLREEFYRQSREGDVDDFITAKFEEDFFDLYWRTVDQMDEAVKRHLSASGMTHKEGMIKARDKLVAQIHQNTLTLVGSFEGLLTLAMTRDEDGLDKLREDLSSQLNVATRMEEEMGGGFVVPDNAKEYME